MSPRSRLLPLALAVAGLSLACTLTFAPGLFQSLRLFYELSSSLEPGEARVVQTLAFPEEVKLKKRFLSVAGRLEPASGDDLPDRLELVAATVDVASGRNLHTIKLTLKIDNDGGFAAIKKLKKNLDAGSMTTVTVEAVGARLDAGTGVTLCVDIVKKKGDLADSTCSPGGSGPMTFSAIQAQVFTPSCAEIGCHDSATASEGLVLDAGSAYEELVGVPSNQVSFRLRVEPGNADNSYLMMKLRGSAGINGVRMPLDGPPFLSGAQLDGIAEWIESGAPNN